MSLFTQHEPELRDYLDRTFGAAKIEKSIAKPENHYWIASVGGLPVGYGKVKFPSGHALLDARAPAQLQKVYVLSEYIAHGVGSALLQELMAEGARAGGDTIWLNVLSANARDPLLRAARLDIAWRSDLHHRDAIVRFPDDANIVARMKEARLECPTRPVSFYAPT